MTILGVFLLNQIRTGGDRRYLELMESLAERGNKIILILNNYFDYKSKFITEIRIPVKYYHFPPVSYLFKLNVKRHFTEIMSAIGDLNSIEYIYIHDDIHFNTAIFLKKRITKPLFYASLSTAEYFYSLLYELVKSYREKQITKFADLIIFQNSINMNLFIMRNKPAHDKTIIISGNTGLPHCIPYSNFEAQFENAIIEFKKEPLIQKPLYILGVFLINEIRTGGDRDYIELLELLAQHGNKVYVIINIYLDYKPKYIIPIYINIKYIRRGFPPASFLFKYYVIKNINYILQQIKIYPHIIHIHGDIYLKGALFIKKKLSIPLFYASRANDIDRAHILRKYQGYTLSEYLFSLLYEPINHFREKQIAKYANMVTFLNPLDKDRFIHRTGHSGKGISIIPNHIGYPHCIDETKDTNNSSYISNILYVGALSPSKGIMYLLKAISILKSEGFNLHYYILGRLENEKKALSLIKKLKIENELSIEGFQNPFPYYKTCDLLICPTLYDGFSNVIIEALHAGCPVLASNLAGPSYILKYDELLFKLGNSLQIAEKIKKNVIDNEIYQNTRRLCHERAEVFRFNWTENFEKIMIDYLRMKKTNVFTVH